MKHSMLFFVLLQLCFCNPSLYSQEQSEGIDSLYNKVQGFGVGLPQEKVYLHIDNTCYFVGDTIWYKGYVTRSDKGTLTDLSKILYVELLTPDGYLVERQQLEMPDGTTHGAFVLTDSLYAGYYELRAYTRWMLNFGRTEYPHIPATEKNFYSRKMAKEYFRDYEKLYSRVFPVYDQPKEAGRFVKDMTLRPMRRYYRTRTGKPKLDLKFYPEGGSLVTGASQRVAFELNTEEGEHLEGIEISIRTKSGDEVVRTCSGHRGRGMFLLEQVSERRSYRANFHYGGYDYAVDLPEVVESGCVLRVENGGDSLCISVHPIGVHETLGLHVMHGGVTKFFCHLPDTARNSHVLHLPAGLFPTGVNQLTVYDGRGRIHADRLFFVNHGDFASSHLSVNGVEKSYEPYDSIFLSLRLANVDTLTSVSLSIRDRSTDEPLYDNGTILTELLLGSELRGFVENPGYYFERNDSVHRHDLDLLMMVQGWRRYDWREMAGVEVFDISWLPEKFQTIAGCVNKVGADERDIDFEKASNLKGEVNVLASFVQGSETLDLLQTTKQGSFYLQMPKIYGDYMLFLMAARSDKGVDYMKKRLAKGLTDERNLPDYYVKLDHFHPLFPKPYNYYHDALRSDELFSIEEDSLPLSFTNRRLPVVSVRNRRGGLRAYDPTKPALVLDAYEAYNMAADYGLCAMPFYYYGMSFNHILSSFYIGDMNMYRRYFVQKRYDGIPMNMKNTLGPSVASARGGFAQMEKYRQLSHVEKFYVYTDYVPREQGSWKYKQDNQPEVIVDFRLYPNDTYFPACRERRYILRGYAVCEDFYSPDYSRKPLPEHCDYRRTLLWIPQVKFDSQGEARIRLYNNGKTTSLSIEAEGIDGRGYPIVWKAE